MEHFLIMPKDSYISDSGRLAGCVVRKSPYGVETKVDCSEVRYVFDLSPEALKQAWEMFTCDITLDCSVYPCIRKVTPKPQEFVIIERS